MISFNFLFLLISFFFIFLLFLGFRFFDFKKRDVLFLLILLIISFFFRYTHLTETSIVYYDEDWNLDQSKNMLELGENCRCYYYDNGECKICLEQSKSPIFIKLNSFIFKLFGVSESIIRFVYAIINTLTVGLFYFFIKSMLSLYGKKLFSSDHSSYYGLFSLIGSFIWGSLMIFLYYSWSIIPITYQLFFSLLSLIFLFSFIAAFRKKDYLVSSIFGLLTIIISLMLFFIRYESIFLLVILGLLLLFELMYSKIISKKLYIILSLILLILFIVSIFFINFLYFNFILSNSSELNIDSNVAYFAGKPYGKLLSFNLLKTNLKENVLSFFDKGLSGISFVVLIFLILVSLVFSFIRKKSSFEKKSFFIILVNSFLFFWIFYMLYYLMPLSLVYNERKFILFLLFLLPILIIESIDLLPLKKNLFYILIILLVLFSLFFCYCQYNLKLELFKPGINEYNTMLADYESAQFNPFYLSYEISPYSFNNISSLSLLYHDKDLIKSIIKSKLSNKAPVLYVNQIATNFYYRYDVIRNQFFDDYIVTNNSNSVVAVRSEVSKSISYQDYFNLK